jgi:uncharacterized protein (DUF2141 family)
MKNTIRTALLALAICAPLAHAGDLTLHVDKVQAGAGTIMVSLYDSAASYFKRPARVARVAASAGATIVVISDLAAGDYAITVYQDVNGNGQLERNLFGIPTEPFGFGNDAQGEMGPPSFDATKVTVPAAGLAATVTLR